MQKWKYVVAVGAIIGLGLMAKADSNVAVGVNIPLQQTQCYPGGPCYGYPAYPAYPQPYPVYPQPYYPQYYPAPYPYYAPGPSISLFVGPRRRVIERRTVIVRPRRGPVVVRPRRGPVVVRPHRGPRYDPGPRIGRVGPGPGPRIGRRR